jgi:HTH-type transcriptional regulator/antitoxin HigA
MMKTIKKRALGDSYMEMIRVFPLRPIRNEAECDAATKILDKHFIREDMDSGMADYIQVLATLVADYEEKYHRVELPKLSPIERLKYLMTENDMTTADLGRLLGNSGLASMILHGKRAISKANAKILARRFGLDAGAFI